MTPCEYFLVEYAPFPSQDFRLPIGLILIDGGGAVRHAMTPDWRAVRCLDRRADVTLLNSLPAFLEQLVRQQRASGDSSGGGLRQELVRMAESNLGTVQIARPRGVEAEDPVREFDRLFEEHVVSPCPAAPRSEPRAGSRRWIHSRLRQALEHRPFWSRLQRNISVEEFTVPGDRFHIDFSYRPNGVTKYLHALSLEHDCNQAKVLSFTFQKIRARMPAAMTAIVAEESPRPGAAQSCQRILLESEIALQPLASLESLADQIHQELGPVV